MQKAMRVVEKASLPEGPNNYPRFDVEKQTATFHGCWGKSPEVGYVDTCFHVHGMLVGNEHTQRL